ncbi:ABC transporter permease [Tistrella bauzanensis]|uniref:ABC transporter permease n=1 Tax=Tistrella arctica TaxID=3133430 RepID=A0ABU9YPC1_9PROT
MTDLGAALPPTGRHRLWRAAADRSANIVPVLTVAALVIAIWYLGAFILNSPQAIEQLNRQGIASPTTGQVLTEAFGQRRPVLPTPDQVLVEIVTSSTERPVGNVRNLLTHAIATAQSTLAGFVLGTILGMTLAIGMAALRPLERGVLPWIVASQTVPILAIAPMVVVVLGNLGFTGLLPKAVISMYLCFFPVAIGMTKGLRSADPLHMDLMHSYDASPLQVFLKLRLPTSLPYLFASLKVAIAAALVGAIVGELPTGGQAGLGTRLLAGSYYGQTTQIWAALIAASVLSALLVQAVALVERVVIGRSGGVR